MSLRPVYSVWCDGPGCLQWTSEDSDRERARHDASKQVGWLRVGHRDYCSQKCKDAAKEEKRRELRQA